MTICFTGHRPNKLAGGYSWDSIPNKELMNRISDTISDLMKKNPNEHFHFITGGAIGVDQMAFQVCRKLQASSLRISIEVAIPFLYQDTKWNSNDKTRWLSQLLSANEVTEVDTLSNYKINGYQEKIYYPAKMQKRNEYMVDKSDVVIAVWDGSPGGTGNCVNYAKRQKKTIIRIKP